MTHWVGWPTAPVFLNRLYQRCLLASVLWLIAWPMVYYFKNGEITGPSAWFWIIGEVNYPVVAVAYLIIDNLLSSFKFKVFKLKPWMVFVVSVLIIAACTPAYFDRYGFTLGVTIEARFL